MRYLRGVKETSEFLRFKEQGREALCQHFHGDEKSGTLVGVLDGANGCIIIGASCCAPGDKFDRHLGRAMAYNRCMRSWNRLIELSSMDHIPIITANPILSQFINRCVRYFAKDNRIFHIMTTRKSCMAVDRLANGLIDDNIYEKEASTACGVETVKGKLILQDGNYIFNPTNGYHDRKE